MDLKLTGIALVIFIMVLFIGFIFMNDRGVFQGVEFGSHSPAPPEESSNCAEVTSECEAIAEVIECDKETADRELRTALRDPLKNEHCNYLEAKLAESCPLNCKLDFSTLLVIPGKISISQEGKEEDCRFEARRSIRVRATCRAEE